MNINKVFLMGNLTRDPETKALPSGLSIVNFGLATNRVFTDKQGQKQQQVEFHNIVAFGKQADVLQQYMKKGNSLFVEGRIQTQSWDGQDGQKKFKTEIIVENFQFGPKPLGASEGGAYTGNRDRQPIQKDEQKEASDEVGTIKYPDETDGVNPDEIPF